MVSALRVESIAIRGMVCASLALAGVLYPRPSTSQVSLSAWRMIDRQGGRSVAGRTMPGRPGGYRTTAWFFLRNLSTYDETLSILAR